MSTFSISSGKNYADHFSTNWIVSKKWDLLWFIGGAFAGYFLFFLHAGLHLDMVVIWFLWVLFLDSPHFFGTYLRTYLDREEWHARRKLLIGSLVWFFVGPVMVGFSYLLHQANIENYKIPFLVFIVFFNLWAYWHVVRQHFGIMSLYKKKNNDYKPADTRADKMLLYAGLIAPFFAFIVRHPDARKTLGLSEAVPPFPAFDTSAISNTPGSVFSTNFLRQFHPEHIVIILSVLTFVAVIILFTHRQVQKWRMGEPLNLPKILFMVALIPLYAMICYSNAVLTAPLLAFSAFVTIYHDVQYHAIVWFYSKNRYHRPGVDPSKYGLAVKITHNFATYMFSGILMAAAMRFFGCAFELHPGCGVLVMTTDQILFGSISGKELLLAFLLGFPLQHYFIDQYIWRPSRDATLRKDLKIKDK